MLHGYNASNWFLWGKKMSFVRHENISVVYILNSAVPVGFDVRCAVKVVSACGQFPVDDLMVTHKQ